MDKTQKYVNISVRLTLGESTWTWHKPNVSTEMDFTIPVEMFSSSHLANLINDRMLDLKKGFPQAKAEYEAEEAKKAADAADADA